ncbi:MAG: BatA domain-containing protein, partial [Bacteroidota bacterium]
MQVFEYVNPQYFWLLLLLPLLLLWYIWKAKKQTADLRMSSLKGFKTSKNWLARLRPLLFALRLLALAAVIVAITRPRTVDESTKITRNGLDLDHVQISILKKHALNLFTLADCH